MEYLNTYATNVGNPVYSDGEKWILNYDKKMKFQVMDTSNLKEPIFGKKVFLRMIVTNKRVLMSLPEKNLYKEISFENIVLSDCSIIKGGFRSKKKFLLKTTDRQLYFLFGKKKCYKEVFDKLKNLMVQGGGGGGGGKPGKPGKTGSKPVAPPPPVEIKVPWSFDLGPYSEIFEKDEKTAKEEAYKASPEAIDRNLKVLIGRSKNWCSDESEEVIDFRTTMRKLKIINSARLQQIPFEQSNLPLYLSNEPEPKDSSHIFFLCGVHIDTCEQFHKPIFQSCQCDVKTYADSFLTEIIRKANNIRAGGTPEIQQKDWVLKVTGANEYIYGKNELFKFEAIRRALKYGKPYIELNLLKKEGEESKIDHQMGRLRHIEYFPNKTRENIVLDHQEYSYSNNKANLPRMTGLSIKEVDVPFRITMREFVCGDGENAFDGFEDKSFRKAGLDFKDCVVFLHAQLVFGHFLLAEGFSKARSLSNRTVFDEEIELWASMPDKKLSTFFPAEQSCRGHKRILAEPKMDVILDEKELRRRTINIAASVVKSGVGGEKFMMKNMARETVLLMTIYARKFDEKDPMTCPHEIVDFITEPGKKPVANNWDIFKRGVGEIKEGDFPLGSYSMPMIRFNGKLEQGMRTIILNKGQAANLWSFGEGSSRFLMTMELMEFSLPVYYPTKGYESTQIEIQSLQQWETANSMKFGIVREGTQFNNLVKELLLMTPLEELSPRQKWMMWKGRDQIKEHQQMLFPFLRAVPCQFPQAIVEAKKLLREWAELENPLDALELLDFKYADTDVRSFAVNQLDKLPDHELRHYILQLVQALKFELYHDSPLARFLLKRALGEEDIGQNLFWYLKSEMHIPSIRERFGLINEEFLRNCGGFRVELLKQACVVEQLLKMSKIIVDLSASKQAKKDDLHKILRHMLSSAKFPPIKFKLPLSSKVEICEPVIAKCRVMGSAKKPLFLFFKNADPFSKDLYGIMFKVGDDLRQDMLTLQMLRIFDLLWKQNGLDFHIRPYGCITTGDQEGMIEIVQRSDTIANIMCHFGVDLRKQLLPDCFVKWLELHNPKSEYDEMRENFKKSSAGYCIASLTLGLGDRHADNIMMSKNGDLFHIDFGHFLGHKKAFKVKVLKTSWDRETTPFVFTYQYASVFNNVRSEKFKEFEHLCVRAFTLIRENAKLLMVLLMLMLGCGIPELRTEKEIEWIPKILDLKLHLSEEEIKSKVHNLIMESVKNKRQIMSDIAHNLKHKGVKGAIANPFSLMGGLNFEKHINSVL